MNHLPTEPQILPANNPLVKRDNSPLKEVANRAVWLPSSHLPNIADLNITVHCTRFVLEVLLGNEIHHIPNFEVRCTRDDFTNRAKFSLSSFWIRAPNLDPQLYRQSLHSTPVRPRAQFCFRGAKGNILLRLIYTSRPTQSQNRRQGLDRCSHPLQVHPSQGLSCIASLPSLSRRSTHRCYESHVEIVR